MRRLLAAAALAACAACGNAVRSSAPSLPPLARGTGAQPAATTPIRHLVILIQENRSFDNFFATYPGANGASHGRVHTGRRIPLRKIDLHFTGDFDHSYKQFVVAYDGGKMDGYDNEMWRHGDHAGHLPYAYVDPDQIRPYWILAKRYVLADRFFQTQQSGSFTAHQDLIAGGTPVGRNASAIDFPDGLPWGCDAPAGTQVPVIDAHERYVQNSGQPACFTYPTLGDLLEARHLSWKYYIEPDEPGMSGYIWNGFDAIDAVRNTSRWTTNVISPETRIFDDVAAGRLPAVAWVVPKGINSDHAGGQGDYGPQWVASVIDAIGSSPLWSSTAIVVVWDDAGGWYDHVPPPKVSYDGLGLRVPGLIVSPYAKHGYVSHTLYEFGSILRFAEDNWNLGRLGTSDVRANSISDAFDFQRAPRPFEPVPSDKSRAFFLHQARDRQPVDTQ